MWASLVAQMVKNLPAVWKTWVRSLGGEDPLEEGIATHSSILAWRIPWTEEPGGLYSPWGPKELDVTEWLTLWLHFFKWVYLCQFFRLVVGVKRDSRSWLQRPSTAILYKAFAVTQCLTCCLWYLVCFIAQPCLTACDPVGCNSSGSSIHGDSPGKNTGVGCHAFLQGIVPTQGLNPGLLHYGQIL